MVWEISWQEFLSMGGTIMVPLVAVALLLSYCIVERLLYFTALRRDDIPPDDVIGLLEKRSATLPEGSGLYRRMLTRFLSSKEIYGSIDIRVLEETNKGFLPELRKNFNLIACLITAAPLLGLLGTVTGMIHTFNVMNIFGTGNAKAMSSGISEAMITTQFGLVIAIVGLYAQLLIARRARRAELAVEELTRHIIRKFEL